MMARLIAGEMSKVLGQSVVVDNRGGGGGTIGAEMGVRAAPDGYTLLLLASSYASNAVLYKLPYDPVKDLKPVVLLGETGFLIALNTSVPAKTIKELIEVLPEGQARRAQLRLARHRQFAPLGLRAVENHDRH